MRAGGPPDHGQITLNDDFRSKIHRHLNTVRKIVNTVEIEERLRENIFKRLNQLATEVDRGRSGPTRFADAFFEITAAVGDGCDNLEPAVKIMERIGGLFGKARKQNDVNKIAEGDPQKLISGPEDVENSGIGDLDDEIPF